MRQAVLFAAALVLSGCYGDYVQDHRERFPVAVNRDAPVLLLAFPAGSAQLSPEEAARLDSFLAAYRAQNSGPLRVTAQRGAAVDPLAVERLVAVEQRATRAGIPKAWLEAGLADGRTPVANVVLAYERYVATAPECGDWSKESALDRTNTPSSNFGCATQRYLGQMVADPKDLLQQRSPGSHDAARMSDVLQKYRAGAPTAATAGTSQTVGSTTSQ